MKYCPFCGFELNDDDLFCTQCGAKQDNIERKVNVAGKVVKIILCPF